MASEAEKVTTRIDGKVETHMGGGPGDYATMCGIDGADEYLDMTTIPTPVGQKIDCAQCKDIWEAAVIFVKNDFEKEKN